MNKLATAALTLAVVGLPAFGAANVDVEIPERPTYSRDVASILNEKCVRCHRPGQGAPMTLGAYEEVRPWVKSIARNVEAGIMPPWHVVASVGPFRGDRSLADWQKTTLLRWIAQGSPEGDPADLPESPSFPETEWRLGEPDFVVTLPEVTVPAGGPDVFENLTGKVMLPEDRWISAVEILPGNPKVVHHVLTFQVKGFNVDPEQGWLGAWAAGSEPMVFPEGSARQITKGSNIIGDMHYHPVETEEKDITRVGFHFVDEAAVEKELVNLWVMNTGFEIPPGDANHEVRSTYRFVQSGKIHSFAPHMHYRGKDFSYTATYPDGRQELLLAVEDYDFNWQTLYTLEEPLSIPEGTVIECVAHFDNSAGNPDNPDPTISVTFGDESYDEMMIGFIDFVVDDGIRPETIQQTKARYLESMAQSFPGDVYMYPDSEGKPFGMHIPRSGEGTLYLRVNRNLAPCRIFDIEWNGQSFTASVDVPNYDVLRFEGASDGSTFSATLHLRGDRTLDFVGAPAAGWVASSGNAG